MEKILRAATNCIKILGIKARCRDKVRVSIIQPMRIRSQLYIQNNCKKVVIGNHFKLETNAIVRVVDGGELIIGNNCFVNCNTFITAAGKTVIGDNCLIGPNVLIFDHDHLYKDDHHPTSNIEVGEITIGNNVWIGGGSIILKGAEIGDNCVIAAGSIVKKKVPANTVLYQKREDTIIEYSK